ncbi:hypothetical protein FJT64_013942 [Amphibalanus amphitrite]|uniref:Uncharacterized protein n=1 Tax=Amphibalanus amphitrite TaxID=1232801 RepID=A0A6A4V115_AMPAM|nr:hypothetical protein FJT64_013942 [Amphibalanus amphitrite]
MGHRADTRAQSRSNALARVLLASASVTSSPRDSACDASRHAIDMQWYNVDFEDMRLAGNVLIVCGFFLVLFPSNWPNYIRSVIRWGRRHHSGSSRDQPEPVDYRTGIISRSHLRSPSGHVR